MRVSIVKPPSCGLWTGNEVTAARWTSILEQLGHEVRVSEDYDGQPTDLLVALHASRSAESIRRFREARPDEPLVVALTGTDVYCESAGDDDVARSLELADRIVALQPLAREELPPAARQRLVIVLQSVERVPHTVQPSRDRFDVCVIAHLRDVKDPFRAAEASRLLPERSRIHIWHIGGVIDADMEQRALEEQQSNPRFTWVGELSREETLRRLSGMRLLVLSSRAEGGANVVGEAIVYGVPVLSSAIPGSVGLLGQDYPGLFGVGDTEALAALLRRAEEERDFLEELSAYCRPLAPRFSPSREEQAWRELLADLAGKGA